MCKGNKGRRDDGREAVIEQNEFSRFPRHVRSALPHGYPDRGGPECRGVIDAIAGHGNEVTPVLQRLHDANLLFGIYPRIHAYLFDMLREFTLGQLREFGARQ